MSTLSFLIVAYVAVTKKNLKNAFLQHALPVGLNSVLLVKNLLIRIYYTSE